MKLPTVRHSDRMAALCKRSSNGRTWVPFLWFEEWFFRKNTLSDERKGSPEAAGIAENRRRRRYPTRLLEIDFFLLRFHGAISSIVSYHLDSSTSLQTWSFSLFLGIFTIFLILENCLNYYLHSKQIISLLFHNTRRVTPAWWSSSTLGTRFRVEKIELPKKWVHQ